MQSLLLRMKAFSYPVMSGVVACGVIALTQACAPNTVSNLNTIARERGSAAELPLPELRVCADPNNLPFSNERGEGFENELAELIGRDLNRGVRYVWWAQRRGFARNTLQAGLCDLIVGVPSTYEMAQTTRSYYRSTYVFVTRVADDLSLTSLDDPRLRVIRIGVHTIGDDYSNVPPAHALASRGVTDNVRGYSIYGDYSKPDPPRALIDALAAGDIDVAIAWGPLAGYFAQRAPVTLRVTPIAQPAAGVFPMSFDISMGVRSNDDALKEELERVLARRAPEIRNLLVRYGVPLVTPDLDPK